MSIVTREKIEHEIVVIDCAVEVIAENAITFALNEEDEYKSYELFELIRSWVQRPNERIYDPDEYLDALKKWRDISFLSQQKVATVQIMKRIEFFENNEDDLREVLKGFKRQDLYERLALNAHLN